MDMNMCQFFATPKFFKITTDSLLTTLFRNFQAPGSLMSVGRVGIVHGVGRPKARWETLLEGRRHAPQQFLACHLL
jgi:hypothetical protein